METRFLKGRVGVFVFGIILLVSQMGVAQSPLFPAKGFFDQAYTFNLLSILNRFGKGPYTYQLVFGALPPGLSMNSSGLITGTPTTLGVFAFSVRVTDSSQPPQQKVIGYYINIVVGFDKYGGLTATPLQNCNSTGYFQLM